MSVRDEGLERAGPGGSLLARAGATTRWGLLRASPSPPRVPHQGNGPQPLAGAGVAGVGCGRGALSGAGVGAFWG
eukprot:15454356-Alexandrium_andersonii.AAC.1